MTTPLGHNLTPEGEWTVLYCGHTVPGYLTYGIAVECPTCAVLRGH